MGHPRRCVVVSRTALDETDQLDKNGLLSDHEGASESSVLGHTLSSEASRFGASPDEVLLFMTGPHLGTVLGITGLMTVWERTAGQGGTNAHASLGRISYTQSASRGIVSGVGAIYRGSSKTRRRRLQG